MTDKKIKTNNNFRCKVSSVCKAHRLSLNHHYHDVHDVFKEEIVDEFIKKTIVQLCIYIYTQLL